MTFTSTTLRKLRELGLPDATFDRILEIFEEARVSKPKKGGAADRAARGTRLPDDWKLSDHDRQAALAMGLRPNEVTREEAKFRNYWTSQPGTKGIKLNWRATWNNWCISTLERAGRPVSTPAASAPAGASVSAPNDPSRFDDATWRAIAKRFKSGGPWSPEWGPPPGRMDCLMPDGLL